MSTKSTLPLARAITQWLCVFFACQRRVIPSGFRVKTVLTREKLRVIANGLT